MRLRLFLVLATLFAFLVPAAGAAAGQGDGRAIEIGRIGTGTTADGRVSILIPIRYRIELAGHSIRTTVRLRDRGHGIARGWVLHDRLNSGRRRSPERRRSFVYVHRIDLSGSLAEGLSEKTRVEVAGATRRLPPAGRGLCSSIPRLRMSPGRTISVPLPACGDRFDWTLTEARHGRARIQGNRLIYKAPRRFRGNVEIKLVKLAPDRNGVVASTAPLSSVVGVTVGTADPGVVVRALGDSVTAGFGYYSNGTAMKLKQLLGCRPPEKGYDDACSSNSLVTSNRQATVEYAPDFGLANNVSWAAQWANEHGLTDYANYAVSGSEPADWAPGGEFHATTERIEREDPDYILMTMGANPLLSEMLFGLDHMGCAVYADVFGGYRECVEAAFAAVNLRANLKALYTDLANNTDATIFLMRYHLSVPSVALAYSATQIAEMGKLLNREIEAVAAAVSPQRLRVVSPPHFDVGIDISPVYPSRFSCSRLGHLGRALFRIKRRSINCASAC